MIFLYFYFFNLVFSSSVMAIAMVMAMVMAHGPWTMENRYSYVEIENRCFSTPVCPFELIPRRFCAIFLEDSF